MAGEPLATRAQPRPEPAGLTRPPEGQWEEVKTGETESITLPSSLSSVASARRFVSQHVPGSHDAVLVASELVTNAVVNTEGPVRVSLTCDVSNVTIEVWDDDPTALPQAREAALDRVGGRGLHIVGVLSEAWGHRADPPGKVVWARVPVSGFGAA